MILAPTHFIKRCYVTLMCGFLCNITHQPQPYESALWSNWGWGSRQLIVQSRDDAQDKVLLIKHGPISTWSIWFSNFKTHASMLIIPVCVLFSNNFHHKIRIHIPCFQSLSHSNSVGRWDFASTMLILTAGPQNAWASSGRRIHYQIRISGAPMLLWSFTLWDPGDVLGLYRLSGLSPCTPNNQSYNIKRIIIFLCKFTWHILNWEGNMQTLMRVHCQVSASTHSELVMTRAAHALLWASFLILCFQRGSIPRMNCCLSTWAWY